MAGAGQNFPPLLEAGNFFFLVLKTALLVRVVPALLGRKAPGLHDLLHVPHVLLVLA